MGDEEGGSRSAAIFQLRSSIFHLLRSLRGLWARKLPEQEQAHEKNADAHELRRRGDTTKVADQIITAEQFHEGAQHRIADEISREHLAIKFFATKQPGQRAVQSQIQ